MPEHSGAILSRPPETSEYDIVRDTNRMLALTQDIGKAKVIAKLKSDLKHFTKSRINKIRNVSMWATIMLTVGTAVSLTYHPLFYIFITIAIFGIASIIFDSENHLRGLVERSKTHVITNFVSGTTVILVYIACALHVWDLGLLSVLSSLSLALGVLYLMASKYGNKVTVVSAIIAIAIFIGMTVHIHNELLNVVSHGYIETHYPPWKILANPMVLVCTLILLSELFVLASMNASIGDTIDFVINSAPTVAESIGEAVFAAEAFDAKRRTYDFFLNFLSTLQTVACSKRVGQFGDLNFSASIEPASEISGDFFDIYEDGDNGGVVFWVGDVCGKGANAGIVMSSIQASMHSLLRSRHEKKADVASLLASINDMIYHVFNARVNGAYMTTMSIFSYQDGVVTYTGEHENVILLKDSGDRVVFDTKSYGAMLGIDSDVVGGKTGTFDFCRGDKLVLYSDGFVEQTSRHSGRPIGFDAFLASASRYYGQSAEATRVGIINDIKNCTGITKFDDDATIMVITR